MVGMGGSSGWAARRTPDCSATGMTSARNLSRRRHSSSCEMEGSVPGRSGRVVDHVPDHSVRNGNIFGGAIHAEGDGVSASERGGYAAADAGQAEVVAQNRNAGFAHAANDCFDLFDLLRALRAVEKNVVPVCGVEIFDRGQDQACVFNLAAKCLQFLDRPKLFRIARSSPGLVLPACGLIVARVRGALVEIVDQVDHHDECSRPGARSRSSRASACGDTGPGQFS